LKSSVAPVRYCELAGVDHDLDRAVLRPRCRRPRRRCRRTSRSSCPSNRPDERRHAGTSAGCPPASSSSLTLLDAASVRAIIGPPAVLADRAGFRRSSTPLPTRTWQGSWSYNVEKCCMLPSPADSRAPAADPAGGGCRPAPGRPRRGRRNGHWRNVMRVPSPSASTSGSKPSCVSCLESTSTQVPRLLPFPAAGRPRGPRPGPSPPRRWRRRPGVRPSPRAGPASTRVGGRVELETRGAVGEGVHVLGPSDGCRDGRARPRPTPRRACARGASAQCWHGGRGAPRAARAPRGLGELASSRYSR